MVFDGEKQELVFLRRIRRQLPLHHLRWGGDEFIAVLPKSSLETATALAENICQTMRKIPTRSNLHVTLSLGVAERRMNESPAALMARADQALYRAKAAGKSKST